MSVIPVVLVFTGAPPIHNSREFEANLRASKGMNRVQIREVTKPKEGAIRSGRTIPSHGIWNGMVLGGNIFT